jgi:hypothetical protein
VRTLRRASTPARWIGFAAVFPFMVVAVVVVLAGAALWDAIALAWRHLGR